MISRKSLYIKPVPQTDTGIRDEHSKARELNLLKELDKLTPYLRYKGCPSSVIALRREHEWVAVKWWLQLLS